jgi:hypothetical protein
MRNKLSKAQECEQSVVLERTLNKKSSWRGSCQTGRNASTTFLIDRMRGKPPPSGQGQARGICCSDLLHPMNKISLAEVDC